MNNSDMIEQEKSVLRWGGLAGILGGAIFILSMVVALVFVPAEPPTFTELVARFPDVQILRFMENVTYLLGLILGIPLILALFFSLRKTSLAPALFGSTISIVGLIGMIVFATPHVAHSSLSEIYHTAGTTLEAQETLGLIWQAIWGVTDTPLYVGFFVGMLGFTLLGVAMFSSQDFGTGLRWVSIVLGAAGLIAALLQLIDPASDFGALSFITYIIFYFILGIKIYRLSKAS
jgi:protein-S-isoprenylcysteine O-methyltransferase Ste14